MKKFKIEVTRKGLIYVYQHKPDMRGEYFWERVALSEYFSTEDAAKAWIEDQKKDEVVKSYEWPPVYRTIETYDDLDSSRRENYSYGDR